MINGKGGVVVSSVKAVTHTDPPAVDSLLTRSLAALGMTLFARDDGMDLPTIEIGLKVPL